MENAENYPEQRSRFRKISTVTLSFLGGVLVLGGIGGVINAETTEIDSSLKKAAQNTEEEVMAEIMTTDKDHLNVLESERVILTNVNVRETPATLNASSYLRRMWPWGSEPIAGNLAHRISSNSSILVRSPVQIELEDGTHWLGSIEASDNLQSETSSELGFDDFNWVSLSDETIGRVIFLGPDDEAYTPEVTIDDKPEAPESDVGLKTIRIRMQDGRLVDVETGNVVATASPTFDNELLESILFQTEGFSFEDINDEDIG